jgi:hypothetical protein
VRLQEKLEGFRQGLRLHNVWKQTEGTEIVVTNDLMHAACLSADALKQHIKLAVRPSD